jgi:CubicO group peptidase (beta-lactamase class C family)
LLVGGHALAEQPVGPWQEAASGAGWSAEQLLSVRDRVKALAPTALLVVQNDRIVASWGDSRRKVNLRSVRKSMLSALYGIAVAEGRIKLTDTLERLGIDDTAPGLTAAEKQATVRDLLMARSGVYHAAAYETADMRKRRPERGSHSRGSFWFYNNWDFNALGTIYRQATGEDIFRSFAERIARPIGMEDFSASDGRHVLEASSRHAAYPFSMSARDAARFGLLILHDGKWGDRQVVPASWIRESTTAYSETDRRGRGYGYLWWTLAKDDWGSGALLASGHGGQLIAIVPSKRLVVVQTVDPGRNPKGVRTSAFLDVLRLIAAVAP